MQSKEGDADEALPGSFSDFPISRLGAQQDSTEGDSRIPVGEAHALAANGR